MVRFQQVMLYVALLLTILGSLSWYLDPTWLAQIEEHIGPKGEEVIQVSEISNGSVSIPEVAISEVITAPPTRVKIGLINIWTGNSQPSDAFLRTMRPCITYDNGEVDIVSIVDESAKIDIEGYDPLLHDSKYRLIRIKNLTQYIHSKAEEIYPQLKGHDFYELGRKICDYRFMFGALFEQYLSPYTHWGWVDVHAELGNLLGPLTRFGFDFIDYEVASVRGITSMQVVKTRGGLTVFQNTDRMRHLFRLIHGLDAALRRSDLVAVDELSGSEMIMRNSSNVSFAFLGITLFGDKATPVESISVEKSRLFWTTSYPKALPILGPCTDEPLFKGYLTDARKRLVLNPQQRNSSIVDSSYASLYKSSDGKWSKRCQRDPTALVASNSRDNDEFVHVRLEVLGASFGRQNSLCTRSKYP